MNHVGAPYRIALNILGQNDPDDDGFEQHILLDHIPHNDLGSTAENGGERGDVGWGKYHAVEVDIPDINCTRTAGSPRCVLQLVQVMTVLNVCAFL